MLCVEKVNLYSHYSKTAEQGMCGELTCIYLQTDSEISPCRKRPGVLILPGGGYHGVSGREAEPIALRFVAKGYAAFILRYSVAPHIFPTSLREAAMAMRYIRENCCKFELNPKSVAAIGFSAGGHLCGTLGMLYDSDNVADIGDGLTIRPDALGLCYPVAVSWGKTHDDSFKNLTGADTALTQQVSLDRLVRPDMPPVFLWHTRNDELVPSRNSIVLAQALEDAGVDYSLRIYHSGIHGLSTADEISISTAKIPQMSKDILEWENHMIEFFRECGLQISDVAKR